VSARERVYDRLRRDSEIACLERALALVDETPTHEGTVAGQRGAAESLRAGADRP
jgi:hypothetical protein